MSYLVYGSAVAEPPPPPPVPIDWPGIESMQWIGWDGSVWDLKDAAGGVVLANEDVTGLWFPPIERHTSKSQSIPGTRHRGWDVDERGVFWPLLVYSRAGSREWLLRNDAFMRTMHPGKTGIWQVTTILGSRRLRCRFDGGTGTFSRDPAKVGWQIYGVKMVAEDPFWMGEDVSITWQSTGATAAERDFWPDNDAEDGFYLSGAFTSGSAVVTNPGDVDAYWRHILTGPINAGAEIGVAGETLTLGAPVAAGQSVAIDTRPDRLTMIRNDGVSLYMTANSRASFPPLPAGTDVPVIIRFSGDGSVQSTFAPSYLRAF